MTRWEKLAGMIGGGYLAAGSALVLYQVFLLVESAFPKGNLPGTMSYFEAIRVIAFVILIPLACLGCLVCLGLGMRAGYRGGKFHMPFIVGFLTSTAGFWVMKNAYPLVQNGVLLCGIVVFGLVCLVAQEECGRRAFRSLLTTVPAKEPQETRVVAATVAASSS